MQIIEICRRRKQTGETVVEYDTGKLLVRLTGTYNDKKTLEEMIYIIACRRLADKIA